MTLELVIFDCDGVLVDSEPIALRIDLMMLAQFGVQMSEQEVIDRFVGRSPEVIARVIEDHVGPGLPADWEDRFDRMRQDAFRNELTAVDGIEQALQQISLPTCVASSSSHESLQFKLGLTGLLRRFDGRIFSASEVANGKPAPDLFLHAAAKMGVTPPACAVVEDSRFGVQAARAAGMDVLAYSGGLVSVSELEGDRTIVFDDMRELPSLLALEA
jgi:HAD superfamily hydrolase (TIGR01509 family)